MINPDGRHVVLVAIFQSRPETHEELTHRLREMVMLTRTEPGCLRYDLHTDEHDPLKLVFIETWADEAAVAAHDVTKHVREIHADGPRLTAAPPVIHQLRAAYPPGE